MVISRLRLLLILMLCPLPMAACAEPASLPSWLRGGPDTAMRSERCSVYRWFFAQADDQTENLASRQDLARSRVINIANKLVDQHQVARQQAYEGQVKYLVFGEKEPFHFTFRITALELDQLLNEPCDEDAYNAQTSAWAQP